MKTEALKTGFNFGGIVEEPEIDQAYFYPKFFVIGERFIPSLTTWEDRDDDNILLHKGSVFLYEAQCRKYCDYLNFLSNED